MIESKISKLHGLRLSRILLAGALTFCPVLNFGDSRTASFRGDPEASVRNTLIGQHLELLTEKGIYDEKGQEIEGRLEKMILAARTKGLTKDPPNGQGLAALLALNIVEGFAWDEVDFFDAHRWHQMIEAIRLALADAARFVADPAVVRVPVAGLLSKGYAATRRGLIRPHQALGLAIPGQPEHRDTVYLTVVDGQGNALSFINSLYDHFGSGLVVPNTGMCLHNRGAGFTLEPDHPNALDGGKRPYHTIIPALALRSGRLWLSFGATGAFMQPQAQVQILVNMADYRLDPQAALDAPRFRVDERGGLRVLVETGVPLQVRKALTTWGHQVESVTAFSPNLGGGQVIAVDPETGVLWGGSEPRKDGCAVGF